MKNKKVKHELKISLKRLKKNLTKKRRKTEIIKKIE